MPLSQQLKRAREVLCWSLERTSERSGLAVAVIARAEVGEGAPDITLHELARLQETLETAGIRIGYDGTVTLDRRRSR